MLTDVAANSASGCRSLQRSKCPRCLATVGTDPIPPGDYARLITYTVDAFTHRLQAHLGVDFDDLPLPEETDAPPDPAEEHLLPPDPEDTYPTIDERAALDDYFDDTPPPDPDTLEYPPDEFDGLQFEKLSANRPTPELGISMENLATLREEYRAVCKEITALDADIRAGNGPGMRAAAEELLRMRHRVDADRPYGHAVTAVMDQWADADADYNDILRMIEHARTQLDALYAAAEPDDLDIASAQADLAFHTRRLPEQPPSLQFQQALAEAQAARTAAAGGHPIVTEHALVIARGDAERADLAARAALSGRRNVLRRELERADRDVAAPSPPPRLRPPTPWNVAGYRTVRSRPPPGRRPHRPHAHSPGHPRRGTIRTRAPHRGPAQILGGAALSAQPRPRRRRRPRNRCSALHPAQHRQRRRPESAVALRYRRQHRRSP